MPADVLAAMLRLDPGRPRITCYDDASGERIELSAKTFANWVAKAANLLQDSGDVTVGNTVGLDLPAHWRTAYWAMAAWSVGCIVVVGPEARDADVVVTVSPDLAAECVTDGRYAVLVTLAALARGNAQTPQDVLDEAKELAGYGDRFDPWDTPEADEPALVGDGDDAAYAQGSSSVATGRSGHGSWSAATGSGPRCERSSVPGPPTDRCCSCSTRRAIRTVDGQSKMSLPQPDSVSRRARPGSRGRWRSAPRRE
jgi:uncharacterized protein (TIGR03089 family)